MDTKFENVARGLLCNSILVHALDRHERHSPLGFSASGHQHYKIVSTRLNLGKAIIAMQFSHWKYFCISFPTHVRPIMS